MENIIIRNETEADYRTVEEITRKAFWNVNVPGCNEHYIAYNMRNHKDFIPEPDLVAEKDHTVVGNVMYVESKLMDENGSELSVLTFGPISVLPEFQRQGISRELLDTSFKKAIKLGYEVVVIFGNPYNYVARGFKSCKKYNICLEGNIFPTAMLVMELVSGSLDGRKWIYRESKAYEVNQENADEFDRLFEPMNKEFRSSQEEFYIHCNSIMR